MRKNKIIAVSAVSLLMSLFVACDLIDPSGDRIVDWAPVSLTIKVVDGHGTDLLNPDNPDNMIDGTTITFKGKTYEATREQSPQYAEITTRAYAPIMYGLYLSKPLNGAGGYVLVFGEIDGAADMDEDLVVTLPDGTVGTIHYHCSKHNERKLSCKRSWKFNGVTVLEPNFTFVVPKSSAI